MLNEIQLDKARSDNNYHEAASVNHDFRLDSNPGLLFGYSTVARKFAVQISVEELHA